MRLTGKTAIVTGAASGIGQAVALRFLAEGARVAGFDIDDAGLNETRALSGASEVFFPIACDLTDPSQVERAAAEAIAQLRRLDVVFNGAGASGRRWGDGPVDACTVDGWRRTLDVNLTSIFLVCHTTVPHLLAAGGGSIINLSSVLGIVGGDADFATHAYAAAKAGIIGLSRAMAVYYAPHRVRVNVIAPGLIATPMSRRVQENERIQQRLAHLQPLTGAMGAPKDVAAAAAYLASDDAAFVTGVVLPVDGGWTAW
ncbi:SDR family NAD(P)-dependent oxidoreductase [Roseiflexus sp.]|uniref:SDR family NAD(P)-dependent oxidoreductase n=1 Tax=Roseiflexus sp. TaxID=2562120 RepID=UPI0021DE32B2|nr:SDR family NAD(P)-dependent oxidoreductase [Roseiflexus sp.]GIW01816.1 MAG: 3-oxoacyl-ACP reductase [Roseiflexus sp.]